MKLILFVGENETSTDDIKCAKQCVRKSDYCRLGKKPVLPFRPGKKGGHKSDLQENANKVKISKTLYSTLKIILYPLDSLDFSTGQCHTERTQIFMFPMDG